jgi:hypothetical protein
MTTILLENDWNICKSAKLSRSRPKLCIIGIIDKNKYRNSYIGSDFSDIVIALIDISIGIG